jgi:hypothetical protein
VGEGAVPRALICHHAPSKGEPAKRSARTAVIDSSRQIAGPSPAIPTSTPSDPGEVTR